MLTTVAEFVKELVPIATDTARYFRSRLEPRHQGLDKDGNQTISINKQVVTSFFAVQVSMTKGENATSWFEKHRDDSETDWGISHEEYK